MTDKKDLQEMECINMTNAAAILGVSPLTLKRYVANGLVPCMHFGRVYRFSMKALTDFMGKQKTNDAIRAE